MARENSNKLCFFAYYKTPNIKMISPATVFMAYERDFLQLTSNSINQLYVSRTFHPNNSGSFDTSVCEPINIGVR